MLNVIFKKINSVYFNYHNLVINFFSLSIIQGLNYILPLVTLPYLIQVLGVEKFGLVAFATSFSLYFSIISDYGYKLTAPRDIAKSENGDKAVNKIANVVLVSKLTLLILCLLALEILINFFSPFKEHALLFYMSFLAVSAQALVPVWFFQGKEDMKYVTYINIFSKFLFLILVFTYVSDQADYFFVPIFNATGFLISALLSFYIIIKKYNYKFSRPKLLDVKNSFIDGWEIFLGSAFTSLYTNSNIVLLGFFTSPTIVGFFSIADKIVSAVSGLFIPLNQALFPFLSRQFQNNKIRFYQLLRKIRNLLFVVSSLFFVIFVVSNEVIIKFVTDDLNSNVLLLSLIMSVRVLSSPFSNLYSNSLIISGRKLEYLKVMKYTVLLNILFVFPLIYIYGAVGLAAGFVTVLWFHTILLYIHNKEASCEQC